MVLSNVLFNYILIFGKFGFPQLGIAGAAIGSSLSELVSVIFFIIYTWRRIDCKKYALNILPKFQPFFQPTVFQLVRKPGWAEEGRKSRVENR